MDENKNMGESGETSEAVDWSEAPAWLDAALIQKALDAAAPKNEGSSSEATIVEEVDVEARPHDVGQHYLSEVYRIHAVVRRECTGSYEGEDTEGEKKKVYERSVVHLVVKTPPLSLVARQTVQRGGFFRAERRALVVVLPRVDEVVRAKRDGSEVAADPNAVGLDLELVEDETSWRWEPLWARCLLDGDNPDEFIVMDDLTAEGFLIVEAARGLDLRHCLLAVRALAGLHAASRLLIECSGDGEETLLSLGNPCDGADDVFEKRIEEELCVAGHEIAQWGEACSHKGARVSALGASAWKRFAAANAPRPGAFNVLVHGDFWANNLLFRYDANERPIAVRAVDWQISHLAAPAVDLLYFLYTSLSDEVWTCHWDRLLREYHTALTEALISLGCTRRLSMEELNAQMSREQSGAWAVFACVHILPLVKSPGCVYTPGAEPSAQAHIYQTTAYRKAMLRALPRLQREGLLDP